MDNLLMDNLLLLIKECYLQVELKISESAHNIEYCAIFQKVHFNQFEVEN